MKLSLDITANQLQKGQTEFAGQPVLNPDKPHVVVKINSAAIPIEEGMWLVEYHDGTKEVWNTDQIKEHTNYFGQEPDAAEDVRPEDEEINENESRN